MLEQATLLCALHVKIFLSGSPTPRFDYASKIEELLVGCGDGKWDIEKAGTLFTCQNLQTVTIDADKMIYNFVKWATYPTPPQLRVIRINHLWVWFRGIGIQPVAHCAEQAGVRCEDANKVEIREHIRTSKTMRYLP